MIELEEKLCNINFSNLSQVPDYCLITVQGEDADTFLQGQCTCDFTQLSDSNYIYGAHCNPKGRMHSNFIAARLDTDCIGLRVDRSISQHALEALKKYSIFSKVTLSISNYQIHCALSGASQSIGVSRYQDGLVVHHSGKLDEIWSSSNTLNTQTDLSLIGAWKTQSILNGIALIDSENIETLLPQEINLDLVDGVSFNKGCYTGQEVVSRLHYRGKLKKHLYIGCIDDADVSINQQLISNDVVCGQVINSTKNQDGKTYFLALCQDDAQGVDSTTFLKLPSAKIQWLPLPYAIN